MIEKYPLQGIVVMGEYSLRRRNHLEKSRLLGTINPMAWCILDNIERALTTSTLSNGPKRQLTGHHWQACQ
jgi:hypothetical protein